MALTGSKTMPEFTAHTFTVQTALTGSRMMPKSTVHAFTKQTMSKSLPSQCKRLWQGQWWCPNLQCIPSQSKRLWHSQWRCPNLYLHNANGFERVNDDAQAHTFTVQTALTGSMTMPKHVPSQCKQLWQGQWWGPSLQRIPSQCKQLWQGQWRCRFPPAPVCRPWGRPGQQCTATVRRHCSATAAGDCSLLHWSEDEEGETELLGFAENYTEKMEKRLQSIVDWMDRGRHPPMGRTDIYRHRQTDRHIHTYIHT